ncbi:unnamed protein product [Effrenium voratum]|nr:unnamed protein product [Effrenium voratum]|mmetsp:Transcript_15432/g.36441  ORF Transcript_15432/g.36441 Transcript_15432/m.36441 type:complete len:269 (+) Transcript_15432:53-859(+)
MRNFALVVLGLTCMLAGLKENAFVAVRGPVRSVNSGHPERGAARQAHFLQGGSLPASVALSLCAFRAVTRSKRRTSTSRGAGFGGKGLSGKWGCFETEGDIDAYWKATGLPWLARKGLQLMDWGAGKNTNIREFAQEGDQITMQYSFEGPGLGGLGFTETYTVGSGVQEITRMGGAKIMVEPVWESESVLRVTNMNPAKQTKGWAKTLITGGSDEEAEQMVNEEDAAKGTGEVIDVHRFFIEDDKLVLEADSSPSEGPVVKWLLKKLD